MNAHWTSIVCGPTGCGKTIFVKTFLRHLSRMSDARFERILFYYAEWQDAYRQLHYNDGERGGAGRKNEIEFREGLPRPEDYSGDPLSPKLVIIDDLMRESSSSNAIVDLFIKGSHHKNLSAILISKNLFHQSRGQRDISLNANYIVVFKNPRDRAQTRHLARQVFPDDPKFLEEAYYDATSRPHRYLLLDLKQSTPDEY
ncbi:uncharacterized protein [Temnothorax nylanderi]|uniref:uncharacterized protein n=1 Tax=Temnothorax nylanderi TaxID=102681 RepID=UPI003A8C093E